MPEDHGHIPVLLGETLDLLDPQAGDVIVDCTVGRGGHSEAFAKYICGSTIDMPPTVVGLDLDENNLAHAAERLRAAKVNFIGVHDSFVRIGHHLRRLELRADVVFADLGFSSNQMDDPERGFSFSQDGPLDMRLGRDQPLTAADYLASVSEKELADVIYKYGEEPLARRIARKLVEARAVSPIQSTSELAELVYAVYGGRAKSSRMHPATRTFMALRIAVNDELAALEGLLDAISRAAAGLADEKQWLKPGARVGVISFHSLEDRIVKHTFTDWEQRGLAQRLTKKPIVASDAETQQNPRARSAKLRVVRTTPQQ